MKDVFTFIGMTDVDVVRAEGVSMGEEPKAKALAGAKEQIAAL